MPADEVLSEDDVRRIVREEIAAAKIDAKQVVNLLAETIGQTLGRESSNRQKLDDDASERPT